MPIEIEVPELGAIEFPDDMSEEDIARAIDDQLASLGPAPIARVPEPLPSLTAGPRNYQIEIPRLEPEPPSTEVPLFPTEEPLIAPPVPSERIIPQREITPKGAEQLGEEFTEAMHTGLISPTPLPGTEEAPPGIIERGAATVLTPVISSVFGDEVGSQVLRSIVNQGLGLVNFATSPTGMVAAGVSMVPFGKAAVGAYFAYDLGKSLVEMSKNYGAKWDEMTAPQKADAIINVLATSGMIAGIGLGKKRLAQKTLERKAAELGYGPEAPVQRIPPIQAPPGIELAAPPSIEVKPKIEALRERALEAAPPRIEVPENPTVDWLIDTLEKTKGAGFQTGDVHKVGAGIKSIDELQRLLDYEVKNRQLKDVQLEKAKQSKNISDAMKAVEFSRRIQDPREAIEAATGTGSAGKSFRDAGVTEFALDPKVNPEVADWLRKNAVEIWGEQAAPERIAEFTEQPAPAVPPKPPVAPKPTQEPTVRLYHGEGGAEGAGLGGSEFSESHQYAARFGPKQSYVDVPRSVYEKLLREAAARGTPSGLILSDEWVRKAKPVEKPLPMPVEVIDEGLLEPTPERTPVAPTGKPTPRKTLPELEREAGQFDPIEVQRKGIVRLLERLETEDKFGRLQPADIPDEAFPEITREIADVMFSDWGELLDLSHGQLIAKLRERLNVIERSKLGKIKPDEARGLVSIGGKIEQAPNARLAKLKTLLKRDVSEVDLLDEVENAVAEDPKDIPQSLKEAAERFRDAVSADEYDEAKIKSAEKDFRSELERAITGKAPEILAAPAPAPTPAPTKEPEPISEEPPTPVAPVAEKVEAPKPAAEPLNKYGVTESQWKEMAGYNDREQMAKWGTTRARLMEQTILGEAKTREQAEFAKKLEKAKSDLDDWVTNDDKAGVRRTIKKAFKDGLITERSFKEAERVAKDRDMGASDVADNVEWAKPPEAQPEPAAKPTFEQMVSEQKAKIQERLQRNMAKVPEDATGVKFRDSDGRTALVTPDPIEPGKWRLTWFTTKGDPMGHAILDTRNEAIEDALGIAGTKYGPSHLGPGYEVIEAKVPEKIPHTVDDPSPPEPPAAPVPIHKTQPVFRTESEKLASLRQRHSLWSKALEKMKLRAEQLNRRLEKAPIDSIERQDLEADVFAAGRHIRQMESAISNLGGDIGIARMQAEAEPFRKAPAPTGRKTITAKILTTQEKDLISKIDAAIKAAPETGDAKITFKVVGDGEFTSTNNKDSLKRFRSTIAKNFPTTVPGEKAPAKPPKPSKLPSTKDPETADIPEIIGDFNSTDPNRVVITASYSDGTQIIATDGRQLIRVVKDGLPGTPDKPVRLTPKGEVSDVEGRYPNWKQIRDPNATLIFGGLNLDSIFGIIKQAQRFRDSIVETGKRSQYSVQLFANKDRSIGARMEIQGDSFEHNLKPDSISLGSYNPDYLENAISTAARLGNKTVDLYAHSGDEGPIGIIGKNSESLIMPMRLENKGGRAPASQFGPIVGKASHSQLPEGWGPLPDINDSFTQFSDRGTTGKFQTSLKGDKVVFEEVAEIRGFGRQADRTVLEPVGEITIADFEKGKASAKKQITDISKKFLGEKHSDVKGLANALFNDAESALTEKRKIASEIDQRRKEMQDRQQMPPGPGAASPSEFAQRQAGGTRVPPGPNPPVALAGDVTPTPEIVRKNKDFNIWNRLNSGQWAFYFGRLGEAAKAAWEKMALAEFRMRESIQRDIQNVITEPLQRLPRQFRKDGGKAFFDVLDGKTMEDVEAEWSGKPGGEQIIEQARIVKTRLDSIRTTIRDIKRESYNRSLMSMVKADLEDFYQKNVYPDTMGKTKQQLADALTLDQFPDDWGIADGSYLPHLFMGQWKVSAIIPGMEGPQFAFRAKTPAEAKAKIFEITKNNPEYKNAQWTASQETVIPADMIRIGDRRFWNMIKRIKDESEDAFDPKEAVSGIIGRKSTKQKWFGSLQQRMGFKNYSRDYEMVMKSYLSGFHRWRELTALNREVIPLIDQVRQEGRLNAEARLNELLENLWGKPSRTTMEFDSFVRNIPVARDWIKPLALDRWSRFATSLVSNLTLSTARFALINRLQPLQGLYPIIGERLLMRAKIMQHTAEGRKLLDDAGVSFDPGQYAGEISGRNVFVKTLERIRGETSNQELAFLGMYLHGRASGLGKETAIRYAKLRGQLMTQFTPMIVDTPSIMEGPVGRVAFQFKRFPVKQIELMARMVADRNLPALTRLALVFATMGGLALLLRQTYSDYDRRLQVQRKLRKEVGEKGADAIYYGLPGLVGADLSGSLVLGDEPFGANVYEKAGRLTFGPGPSLAIEMTRAARTEPRTPLSATEKALILARKIPSIRAIAELTDLIRGNVDVLSPDGEVKYQRTLRDVIFGLGAFRSANESNIQIAKNAMMELDKEMGRLKNRAWVARKSGDQAKIQDAAEEIEAFNKMWPDASIHRKELNDYFKYRRRVDEQTELERTAGKKFKTLIPQSQD